jgi:hypothetical protein
VNGNRIFGPVNPQDMVNRPVRRAEPTARPSRNIFTYQPPEDRPLVKHDKSKLEASFSFAHDEGNASKKTNGTNGINNAPAGKPTPRVTGSIFF